MLVLTRKLQEQIVIGQDITLTVIRRNGNAIQIGIEAPRDVRIVRGELHRFETNAEHQNANQVDAGKVNAPSAGRAMDLSHIVRRVADRCRIPVAEATTQLAIG